MLQQKGHDFYIGDGSISHSKLPVGHYVVEYNRLYEEYYLKQLPEQPAIDHKIYGNAQVLTDIWADYYDTHKTSNVGILLKGVKGTGKTLACRLLTQKLNKPVILITQQFGSDNMGNVDAKFTSFMCSQELRDCVIFIDEFEKVYKELISQNVFLQILDGSMSSGMHQMYLFTVNQNNVNEYFNNRPGRIMFSTNYTYLKSAEIREFVSDNVEFIVKHEREEYIDAFVAAFDTFAFATYDIVAAAIKIFKRLYGKYENVSVYDCMNLMNLNQAERKTFDITETINGVPYSTHYAFGTTPRAIVDSNSSLRMKRVSIGNTKSLYDFFIAQMSDKDKADMLETLSSSFLINLDSYENSTIPVEEAVVLFADLEKSGAIRKHIDSYLHDYCFKLANGFGDMDVSRIVGSYVEFNNVFIEEIKEEHISYDPKTKTTVIQNPVIQGHAVVFREQDSRMFWEKKAKLFV